VLIILERKRLPLSRGTIDHYGFVSLLLGVRSFTTEKSEPPMQTQKLFSIIVPTRT